MKLFIDDPNVDGLKLKDDRQILLRVSDNDEEMGLGFCEPDPILLDIKNDSPISVGITEQIVNIGDSGEYEHYHGQTNIKPDFEGCVLETHQKVLDSDIVVNPIAVVRTSNPSGGKTVYIGGVL